MCFFLECLCAIRYDTSAIPKLNNAKTRELEQENCGEPPVGWSSPTGASTQWNESRPVRVKNGCLLPLKMGVS